MKTMMYLAICFILFVVVIKIFGQGKPILVSELLAKAPGIIIDVRSNEEWNSGHFDSAFHYDWSSGDFQRECIKFDKSKTYYLYCASGVRSGKAADYMKSMGFKNVMNLGGYSNLK